ncbi:MAG: hypothetical protein HGA67_00560 [Candidatus Yonathbacteria bacterium]|nr:hypothetical protein [Candidatus Yonathbacteria bacterium]
MGDTSAFLDAVKNPSLTDISIVVYPKSNLKSDGYAAYVYVQTFASTYLSFVVTAKQLEERTKEYGFVPGYGATEEEAKKDFILKNVTEVMRLFPSKTMSKPAG